MNAGRAVIRAFRRAAAPLLCYYGVTLVLPLANGAAAAEAGFWPHAAVVLAIPVVLILLASGIRGMARGIVRVKVW